MSGILNGYCTLTEFLRYITPPGQTLNEDAPDDAVVEFSIVAASRRIDDLTGRMFYPHMEIDYYDIPPDNTIWFGDDVLTVTSFINGDLTTIASTEYILYPPNDYPKYKLKLRDNSNILLVANSSNSAEQVLRVNAMLGYHESYLIRAWKQMGTLGAAWASTTTLTATLTASHTLEKRGGQIIRIDNEIFNTNSTDATTLTVIGRGDNGSTAATHLINAPIYVWLPMEDIKALTLEIAKIMYHSRYGENTDVVSTYTSAGVIVTPRSLPVWAQEIIRKYQRIV
jgi:hypothetical protein